MRSNSSNLAELTRLPSSEVVTIVCGAIGPLIAAEELSFSYSKAGVVVRT